MKNLLCLLVFAFLLISCEYEPQGYNFRELQEPGEPPSVYVSLNDFYPGDTVFLFKDAMLLLDFQTDVTIYKLTITIDDIEPFEIYDLPYEFSVNTFDFNIGETHTFTLSAVIGSGTQSLADLMGYEGFIGELTWDIYMAGDPAKFQFDYRKSEDGFLELFWNSTEFPESMIDKFVIQRSLEEIEIPASQKSFIDYDYCMGWDFRTIYVYLKGYDEYVFAKSLDINTPEIEIQFEDLGFNEVRVYWDKPFANSLFELRNFYDEVFLTESKDTSIVVPQISFAECVGYLLYVVPEYASHAYKHVISRSNCLDHRFNFPYYGRIKYSKSENLFFVADYDSNISTLDSDFNFLSQTPIDDMSNYYTTLIACAPNSPKIAIQCLNGIKVYPDRNFKNPVTISAENGRTFWLTDDDILLVVNDFDRKCIAYNVTSGEEIGSIVFSYSPSVFDFDRCCSISNDGKFICFCSIEGIEIFEVSKDKIQLYYTEKGRYTSAMFHPQQSNLLIVKKGNNTEIWEVPLFTVKQSTPMNNAVLYNIDPVTGYLLYYEEKKSVRAEKLKISRLDSPAQSIFSIPYPNTISNHAELINQIIITDDSYFNTERYIAQ